MIEREERREEAIRRAGASRRKVRKEDGQRKRGALLKCEAGKKRVTNSEGGRRGKTTRGKA